MTSTNIYYIQQTVVNIRMKEKFLWGLVVQGIVRSHLIEKLGKVNRERWPERGKHQPQQTKPKQKGCGETAWFIFRK